jgi:hypothetical protein
MAVSRPNQFAQQWLQSIPKNIVDRARNNKIMVYEYYHRTLPIMNITRLSV